MNGDARRFQPGPAPMTGGRDALRRLDAAIADARARLSDASSAAASDTRSLAEIEGKEARALAAIAEIRIDHLKENGAGRDADDIAALIDRHDDHIAGLKAALADADARLADLEATRRRTEEKRDDAVAGHDAAAAATRERLEKTPDYQARAAAVETANATAARASQKADLAEADRREKGAPYEADPLFKYLTDRKFGARDYRAFPLFAIGDAWVARLIDYRRHRLNYDRLVELPIRLGAHADRLEALADEAEQALEEMERRALEADGVDALRDRAASLSAEIERLDRIIDETEAERTRLAADYASAARGEAGPLAEARSRIAASMARLTVPDLMVLAAETASPEDDRLVDALVRIRRERLEYDDAKSAAGRRVAAQTETLADLEDIRKRFKRARFDSPYSEFPGRDVLGALLSEFLRGALSRDEAWRRIERAHRTARRDWDRDVGGDVWKDGFGLPPGWGGGGPGPGDFGRFPAPRSGRVRPAPMRIPRAPRPTSIGRPRGGGFRTGGGF